MKTKQAWELHPAGEGDFVFPTYGGWVRLSATEDALTPFGGLGPWAAFVRRCGLFETLSANCPVVRTSPNAAPVYDVLQSYALTVLCDGDRFAHVQRLRCDPNAGGPFGVRSIVSDDTIRRLFAQIEEVAGAAWVAAASVPLWGGAARSAHSGLGCDGADQVWASGGCGHRLQPTPARSAQPASAAGGGGGHAALRGLSLSQRGYGERHAVGGGDGGCAVGAGHAAGVAQPRGQGLRPRADPSLARGAAGAPALSFQAAPHRPLAALPESAWQGPAQRGVLQVAELELRLPGWSRARRVVAGRRLLGVIPAQKAGAFWDRTRHEFEAYVSDLDPAQASGWQIVELYRQQADTENVFDELKHQWGFDELLQRQKERHRSGRAAWAARL